jgi:hypothetical protein
MDDDRPLNAGTSGPRPGGPLTLGWCLRTLVCQQAKPDHEEPTMSTVGLIALILIAIDGLIAMTLAVEGARRHLAGVHLEQELHRDARSPR